MSFFSAIGNFVKSAGLVVAHTARDVGKVGVNIAATQIGVGPIFSNNASPVDTADPQSLNVQQPDQSQQSYRQKPQPTNNSNGTNATLDKIVNSINKINPKVTVDHTADLSATTLPTWAIPAGIGVGVLLLVNMMNNNGRRR